MATEIIKQEPVAIVQTHSDMVMAMVQQALDKGFSGDQLNGLLEFAKNVKAEAAKEAYFKAFKTFKDSSVVIRKTAEIKINNKVQSMYAPLDEVCDILIPALGKVGITHRWKTSTDPDGKTRVTCFLRHELGYEEEGSTLAAGADTSGNKNPIQAVASTVSYLERYTFLGSCGVSVKGMDKDGALPPEDRMPEADLLTWFDALEQAPDDKSHASIFLEAHKAAKARADHLDIDLRAIQTGTKEGAKKVFGQVYAKWRNDNDADALKAVTAEWEKRKAGPK